MIQSSLISLIQNYQDLSRLIGLWVLWIIRILRILFNDSLCWIIISLHYGFFLFPRIILFNLNIPM